EENNVVPIEDAQCDERADKENELGHAPERFAFDLAHEGVENGLGIFAEETKERVSKRMFRLAIVTMFVNRDPIDGLAFLVRSVGVAFVVLHVDAVVENLTEPDADRFEDAEKPVQDRRPEIR